MRKSPERRRDDLLDAAADILVDKGIAAFTVDDVVSSAGVAKGTFYLYFPSKEHLVTALRDRLVQRLMRRQQMAVEGLAPEDWLGRLDTWVNEMVAFYVANAHLHDVLSPGARIGAREAGTDVAIDRHVAALTALLGGGARADAFQLADPRATAVLLYGAIQAAVNQLMHPDGALPTQKVLGELRRLYRRVVGYAG